MTDVQPDAKDWGLPKPEWAQRRRVLWFALVSIVTWVSWILYKGGDSALSLQSMMILVPALLVLVGQYVFGAAWDDRNYMKSVVEYSKK